MIAFAAVVLFAAAFRLSAASEPTRLLLAVVILAALVAIGLASIQLYAHPTRSQALIFSRENELVIATNALHEGYKLRFLRDMLAENVTSFSDDDRARWKVLEADGFYPSLYIRNVRKLIVLRLCTMVFDDVFVTDRSDRWEHHDSSNTSEPSYSGREMPRLKGWKGMSDISA
jgi:hypothetical protein